MQNTIAHPALTALDIAVLECIVYASLFDFPLTPEEVRRWLPIPASLKEVEAALHSDHLAPLLSHRPPYVMLRGREATAELREARRASSAALRVKAERYGRLIARLPFVRMVALTGSLAVDNADDGDDLDYLIVIAPGRVWLTRAMIMATGRLAALRGDTLCPNYLLAESALALPEHDYYTARELAQMLPVAGHAVHARMLAQNAWCHTYLPNASAVRPEPPHATAGSPEPPEPAPAHPEALEGAELVEGGSHANPNRASKARQLAEALLRLPPFDALERRIFARKGTELRRQAGGSEAVFDETMCKGHFEGWREQTRLRVGEHLRRILEGTE